MNAHSRISAAATTRVDPTIDERAHRHVISVHCPNIDEMEMAARCDLAALRDAASAGAPRATPSAALMLDEISRLAAAAVYTAAPTASLIRLRSALTFTMEAARVLDRVQRNG